MENDVFDLEELIAEDLERIRAPSCEYKEPEDDTQRCENQQPPLQTTHLDVHDSDSHKQQATIHETSRHFDSMRQRCLCKPKCIADDSIVLAQSFASMREDDRSNVVRGMLLALAAPRGRSNELMAWNPERAQIRKTKRRKGNGGGNTTTRYCLKGAFVCEFGFAAVVQLNIRTIQRYAAGVADTAHFQVERTGHGRSHKGHFSLQTRTVLAFLRRFADMNALASPNGRGSEDEAPVQWLPSSERRSAVYESYKEQWEEIAAAAAEQSNAHKPDEALSKATFIRIWSQHYPTLRILKAGSDFCDQCTALLNSANSTTNLDLRRTLLSARERHRLEASMEFKLYRDIQQRAHGRPAEAPIHLVFDFAEKVLLPHLLRQPGQLHFVTGLKFDFFGVYSSSKGICYVYGLPEGHWPNNKTCNEVASMLHHTIDRHRIPGCATENHRDLDLHADNCGGQNKNRFMMWYLLWRVSMMYEDEIVLRFLIAGHTKNRCDAAFGMVKRRLKQFDVFAPRNMMKIIDESSIANHVVCSTEVIWYNWKQILERFYTVPSTLKLSRFHVFRFSSSFKEGVMVKELSSDASWKTFRLLKKGVEISTVVEEGKKLVEDASMHLKICSLNLVPSAKEETRERYLVKHVLDRYYKGDERRRLEYFGSGSDWRSHSDSFL